MTTDDNSQSKQSHISTCPSCGGPLKAFASTCGLCGHELSRVAANQTIATLVARFDQIDADLDKAGIKGGKRDSEIVARRARVIRDFPIPNSREDLQSLLHFIHPKIQDNIKPDPNSEDWRVKFKEVIALAKNAYKGDAKTRAEFEEMEKSLTTTLSGDLKTRAKRSPLVFMGVAVVMVLAAIGLGVTQMDKWTLKQCEETYAKGAAVERQRLDAIVVAAQAKASAGGHADAIGSLNQMRWEYQADCMLDAAAQEKSHWEEKRKEAVAAIEKSQATEVAQKKDAADRELAEKKDAADRELAQKKAEIEQATARQITEKAKEASTARKAATNKEW